MKQRLTPAARTTTVRALTAATTLAVTAAVLVGCSGNSSDSAGKTTGLTLTMWYNTDDSKADMKMYKAYEKESGNTLKLIPISSDGFEATELTKWETGDRPDIMEMNGGPSTISQYNPSDSFIDLTGKDFVKKGGSIYSTGGYGPDGKIYTAITNFPEVWGLYYNKDVLAKYNLQPATTYDDLASQCKVLKAAGIDTIAEAGASQWPTFGIPFLETTSIMPHDWDKQVLDKKSTINGPDSPLLTGLTDYDQLLTDGCANSDITTASFEDNVASVFKGQAAYEAIHSNIEPTYVSEAGDDVAKLDSTIGFTPYGATKPGVMVQPGVIGVYALPKTGDSAKQKAAMDFLEFVTGPYYQTYIDDSGTYPILSGAKDPSNATGLMKEIKQAYDAGPIGPLPSGNLTGGGYGDLLGGLSKLIAGTWTPKQVVNSFQSHVAETAKSQGLPGW